MGSTRICFFVIMPKLAQQQQSEGSQVDSAVRAGPDSTAVDAEVIRVVEVGEDKEVGELLVSTRWK